MNEKLIKQFEAYSTFNEQEEKDKEFFLRALKTFDYVLSRENVLLHFCSSAFVVNKKHTKMLVVNHNIFGGWIYPGGHADGNEDFLYIATKELLEETGINAKLLYPKFFSIQSLPIAGHIKNGKYVSGHIHMDVCFLFEADETDETKIKPDENKAIKWIDFKDADNESIVPFIRPIHRKLIEKLKTFEK